MSIEKLYMRMQTYKVDTHRMLSEYFKYKVQLEEQLEDNTVKLHFNRGVVACIDEIEKIIAELQKETEQVGLHGSAGGEIPGFEKIDFEGMAMTPAGGDRDKPEEVASE